MLSCFCVRNSEEDVLYVGVNGGFLGICFGVERRMKPICGCNYIMDFKFSVCFIHYNKIFSRIQVYLIIIFFCILALLNTKKWGSSFISRIHNRTDETFA